MPQPQRIPPHEARANMQSQDALLVCAYENDQKFEQNHLEGALSLKDFESQLDNIDKDRELIFYCA